MNGMKYALKLCARHYYNMQMVQALMLKWTNRLGMQEHYTVTTQGKP